MDMPETVIEQAKSKSGGELSAFAQTLAGFAVLALVMLGVGGTIYKLVAPGGWLAQLFGQSLGGGTAAVLAILAVAVFAWFTREWVSPQQRNRFAELWVYTCAAAGLLYVAQLWINGTL
jgi:hypothetical protein